MPCIKAVPTFLAIGFLTATTLSAHPALGCWYGDESSYYWGPPAQTGYVEPSYAPATYYGSSYYPYYSSSAYYGSSYYRPTLYRNYYRPALYRRPFIYRRRFLTS
jgi:hypothetical protein